jgi:hypothetical protein
MPNKLPYCTEYEIEHEIGEIHHLDAHYAIDL